MKKSLIIAVMLLNVSFASQSQINEQLVVFLNDDEISADFRNTSLEEIARYCEEHELELVVHDVELGVPHEVVFTPAIFYQNFKGRSAFSGRYKNTDRLFNFIRTSRNAPRKEASNVKEKLPVLRNGPFVLGIPIKITGLEGSIPTQFDPVSFDSLSRASVYSNLKYFSTDEKIELPSHSRLFHADFYPYRGDSDVLYLSVAIYSMFSCVEPVYKSEIPFSGMWKERFQVFAEAASVVEKEILGQLHNLTFGDAISPISSETVLRSWKEIGLELPKKDRTEASKIHFTSLPEYWNLESSFQSKLPLVQFNFGAPIDHYSGEAKEIKARINLNENGTLLNSEGHVVVNAQSITMGDAALDNHIFHDYLKVFSFPNASYEFKIVQAPKSWDYSKPQHVKLEGVFNMMDRSIQLAASGIIEVQKDNDDKPLLHVVGEFQLPLKRLFGIEGPDGPSPSKDILDFKVNFLLTPSNSNIGMDADLYVAQVQVESEIEGEVIEEEEFIRWHASNDIYKAKGSFRSWEVHRLEIPYGDFEKVQTKLSIDMNSVQERSKLLVKHLKGDDFFGVNTFPTATIQIQGAKKVGENKYHTLAHVQIKGVRDSIPVDFILNSELGCIEGKASISRNKFGLGTSKKSKKISNSVDVEFKILYDNNIQKL